LANKKAHQLTKPIMAQSVNVLYAPRQYNNQLNFSGYKSHNINSFGIVGSMSVVKPRYIVCHR